MITVPHTLVDIIEQSTLHCSLPIRVELHYATPHNFTGQIVSGYQPSAFNRGLMSTKAATQLCQVQEYALINYGCTLLIYDAYRPLRAAKSFIAWSQTPENNARDLELKAYYYPDIEKHQLTALGYIAENISAHCYGHTVDVVLADHETGKPIDMGTPFDFFGPRSHPHVDANEIGIMAYRNRHILRLMMQRFGFIASDVEYWHFEFSEREIDFPMDFELHLI